MSALYTIIAVVILVTLLVYVHKKYVRISLPAGEVIRQECLPEKGQSEAEIVDDDGDGDDNASVDGNDEKDVEITDQQRAEERIMDEECPSQCDASAGSGDEEVVAVIFGARSTATLNKRMHEILDIGFSAIR